MWYIFVFYPLSHSGNSSEYDQKMPTSQIIHKWRSQNTEKVTHLKENTTGSNSDSFSSITFPFFKMGTPRGSEFFPLRAVRYVNWCPVIVSNRQQVSPILSLAVISLFIDQWDDLLHFKFSVGCKLLDSYDILLILITKTKRVLRKKKQIHTEILDSCLKFGWFYCI